MTGAVRAFGKLGPRARVLYVSSIVISAALVAFGTVILASSASSSRPAGAVVETSSLEGAGTSPGGTRAAEGEAIDRFDDDDDDAIIALVDTDGPTARLRTDPNPLAPSRSPASPPPTPAPSPRGLRPTATSPPPSAPPTIGPSSGPTGSRTATGPSSPSGRPSPSTAPARATGSPSASSSVDPTDLPSQPPTGPLSVPPSLDPTDVPSQTPAGPPSAPPSLGPTVPPSSSSSPTSSPFPTAPLFETRPPPPYPGKYYFDYDPSGPRGPAAWGDAGVSGSAKKNYWSEFGFWENRCDDPDVRQSPVDVCTGPTLRCEEHHEFRSRPGDFRPGGAFMTMQILPNKLRVLMERRTGDEPDPPFVDFAAVGAKSLDMLNIDMKFPSEHTICGKRYDGEMQYYFFHPGKGSLIVLSWLFEATIHNEVNEHMQLLIDEFQAIFDGNEAMCIKRGYGMSSVARSGQLGDNSSNHTVPGQSLLEAVNNTSNFTTTQREPLLRRLERNNDENDSKNNSKTAAGVRRPSVWDPFHPDIQKTIHFWGYTGSLTEPPCAPKTLWRIMDVPVKISREQLRQMQTILFNNRDGDTCEYTSNHYRGSVARPLAADTRYYKCTRRDYVGDDERDMCGDFGCDVPFGPATEPYVDPVIWVTGPPSDPPTATPTWSPLVFYPLG